MSVKMIVTHRSVTRREKSRRRFRHWWRKTSPEGRFSHLLTCAGCVGCESILGELVDVIEVKHV